MDTQQISSQISSSVPQKKLRILRKTYNITTKTILFVKKYAPKYARNVHIVRNDCPKTTKPQLKYLNSSLTFYCHHPGLNSRLKQSQIFKIVKHHKKYIKYCEGIRKTLQLTKQLPQLRSYEFSYDDCESEEKYKIMTFCRVLERIFLNLNYGYSLSEVKPIAPTLKKNRHRMLRGLVNMRFLKELSMKFSDKSSVSLFTFLQALGSCPLFLSRLNFFSIDMLSCSQMKTAAEEEDFVKDVNVRTALRFITDLAMSDHILFEKIVFDHELLGNLTSLITTIKAKNTCPEATIRKLSLLKLLPRLKTLDLAFISYLKRVEKIFLESFSLPKEIETVMLRLTDFVWKDLSLKLTKENRRIIEDCFEKHPRFQNFYSKWKSLDKLQTLKLIIENRDAERRCPGLTLKFAMGILKHMKNLKRIRYENKYDDFYINEHLIRKISPMDLGIFWESLGSSRKTLEDLEIKVPDMNFFAKKGIQEGLIGGFERLRRVEILGQIYWARNFGHFLERVAGDSSGRVNVSVRYLCFKEGKYLDDFFDNLVKIPKNLEVELDLDISGLNCSKWLESFCRFVARLKVEGLLKFRIKEARIGGIKEVNRIQQSVLENPVFEELVVKGEKGRNFCVIKKCELVSGVDPWLIEKGYIKLVD